MQTGTHRAALDASRRLIESLYELGEAHGTEDRVERIRSGLSAPGVLEGRDPGRLALAVLESLDVVVDAVNHNRPPTRAAQAKRAS